MTDDGDGWLGRTKRRAVFNPKDRSTLRPCMVPLIGRTFDFTYGGHSMEDETFPGQSRWMTDRKHDDEIKELSYEALGLWFPSEDLDDVSQPARPAEQVKGSDE
jgi:hypothetical protein